MASFNGAAAATKLDMRFADEEDAADIANLINACEGEVDYRDAQVPKIDASEVESDCASQKSRWIVLETARPQEDVVACVRLCLQEGSQRRAVLDMLSATSHASVSTSSVLNQLLARVEGIARGLGVDILTVETVQWDEEQYDWLAASGYTDVSGRPSTAPGLLKPTMIVALQKDLATSSSDAASSTLTGVAATGSPSGMPDDLAELLDGLDVDGAEVGGGGGGGDGGGAADGKAARMEGLMSDLFSALHKEYPGESADPK